MSENDFEIIIENALPLTIQKGKDLLSCFRFVEEIDIAPAGGTLCQKLKLYALNNSNLKFEYEGLKRLIKNNIANYVLNRKNYSKSIENEEWQLAYNDAIKKLRPVSPADGNPDKGAGAELGELLLYIFFEGFLGAKKLLSKVEIKTNNNDYVKGFDGIHFMVKDYPTYKAYQIVYGESKMKKVFTEAINEAFQSLSECFSRKDTDFNLLDTKFFTEIVSTEEEAEVLKQIIIPGYRNASSSIETENVFGIFIGYTFEFPTAISTTPKEAIDCKVKTDIDSVKQKIIDKISEMGTNTNCDYYVFFLPFNDVVTDKADIMNSILGG